MSVFIRPEKRHWSCMGKRRASEYKVGYDACLKVSTNFQNQQKIHNCGLIAVEEKNFLKQMSLSLLPCDLCCRLSANWHLYSASPFLDEGKTKLCRRAEE